MRNFFTAPALVDIALTNRCNLKCNYCSASSGESTLNNNELTLHDYKTLFKTQNLFEDYFCEILF